MHNNSPYVLVQTFQGVQMVLEEPLHPKAVLLLFHGCKHSSTDWWPKSDGCPACKGDMAVLFADGLLCSTFQQSTSICKTVCMLLTFA